MRLQAFLGYVAVVSSLLSFAVASPAEESSEPEVAEVVVTASFPEDNAFGHVVNGEMNKIFLSVENKSDRNITLDNIAGSFHHPESNALIKNMSAVAFKMPLLQGAKMLLPYSFHSEFKPGDLRLNIWLEHTTDGEKIRVPAYDSIVTIVEPESSFFDIKMWTTYLIVLSLLGGLGYYSYFTFVPQPKKRKTRPAPSEVSSPVGTVKATGTGGYQEEWIPEHHLKKPKARKTRSGVAASGDDTSGAEAPATEGRRRKGKK